jgi:hypothetical protein
MPWGRLYLDLVHVEDGMTDGQPVSYVQYCRALAVLGYFRSLQGTERAFNTGSNMRYLSLSIDLSATQ